MMECICENSEVIIWDKEQVRVVDEQQYTRVKEWMNGFKNVWDGA